MRVPRTVTSGAAAALAAALLAIVAPDRGTAAEAPAHHHDMPGMQDMPALDVVPGASLYQLDVRLEPAGGSALQLAQLRGRPQLVTMFYSHCTSVCPLLTHQLQQLVAQLPAARQQQLGVLMVSFDPQRDSPAALAAFKAEHHISAGNWLVARGSAGDVRALAAALGIQYRELPDHSFNHSAVITLLDAQGVPRARTQLLSGADPAFMAAVNALLAKPGGTPRKGG